MKKAILFVVALFALFGVSAQTYTTLGIGISVPQGTLHAHSAVSTNPEFPSNNPRDDGFIDDYETIFRLTNTNTGSTENDGFTMSLINNNVVMRMHENGYIKMRTPGGNIILNRFGHVGIGDTALNTIFNVEGTSRLGGATAVDGAFSVSGNSIFNGISTFNNTLNVGNGFSATTGGVVHASSMLTVGTGITCEAGQITTKIQLIVGTNNNYVKMNAYGNIIATGNISTSGTAELGQGFHLAANGDLVKSGTTRLGNGFYCDAQGNVKVKELRVTLTDWPDYVFSDGYHLMPLSEVEDYISANGHLPQMPSAKDVEQEGADLGAMNKLLMQKVEELTLYVIDLQKQLDELKSK